MTCSFHKYGEFFPGTGDIKDVGYGDGKHYAVNFPCRDGMDDESFTGIFRSVIAKVMEHFAPGAVLLQCGTDSLSGDRLGSFNLSAKGHADCVAYVKSFNIPTLVVGGGGYTLRNVARAWCYEASLLVGVDIPDAMPYNNYFEYYGPEYRLHLPVSNMENLNTPAYLDDIKRSIHENLRQIEPVPSVPFTVAPPSARIQEEKEAAARDREDDDQYMMDVSGEHQVKQELKQSDAPRHSAEFYD